MENDRLVRILQATPEQQRAIDRILAGETSPPASISRSGPLLMSMTAAAKLAGVSRTSFWRICQAKKIPRIEILPGSYRVRKEDVEALAGYRDTTARGEPV